MGGDNHDGDNHDGENHRCVGCQQIVSPDASTMRFSSRFQGPPGNANGGVVVGALTCVARKLSPLPNPAVRRVHARLHKGVPQDTDLTVSVTGGGTTEFVINVSHGPDTIVSGTVVLLATDELSAGLPPTLYGPERIAALAALAEPSEAQRHFAATTPRRRPIPEPNPFGRCYVCGIDNPDGLQVRAEPVAAGLAWAANPRADGQAEADGRLDTVIAVASLDCPSVPSVDATDVLSPTESVLLGTFDGEFLRVPPAIVDGGYRLPSQFIERDGRRVYTDIGLVSGAGTVYAIATATWVTVPQQPQQPSNTAGPS